VTEPTKQQQLDLDFLRRSLQILRTLLYDALEAGKHLPPEADWKPHLSGERLPFGDRPEDGSAPGVLILVDEITNEIVAESVNSNCPCYVIVGATLDEAVDLGTSRAKRLEKVAGRDTHYWATFVLDNTVLVTLGNPPSSCRLIGEVLNLQMPTPFVQRRVCASCHALNDYHSPICHRCKKPLLATGRLA
jgi:hypothetical protein